MMALFTVQGPRALPAAGYTGPGDVVSGALAWGGFRAYSAATIGTNAVRIIRASDNGEQDFVTLANGDLDTASIATFLTATTGKIIKLYDQSGNGFDLIGILGGRPDYLANAIGSLSGISYSGAAGLKLESAGSMTQAQPFTVSIVAKRTGNFSAFSTVFSGETTPTQVGFNSSADSMFIYAGTVQSASASDNAFHALQGTINGASSELYIDGTPTSGVNAGAGTIGGVIDMGSTSGSSNTLTGVALESGIWAGTWNSTQKSNMNTNQHTYWGF